MTDLFNKVVGYSLAVVVIVAQTAIFWLWVSWMFS